MKKTFILLTMLVAVLTAHAQTYMPFPTGNAIWSVRSGQGEAMPAYYYYGLKNGDTVINSIAYHKLYAAPDTTFTDANFSGGIREDNAKHIYYLPAGDTLEKLLYDFSLSVNDTFTIGNGYISGQKLIVSTIDSAYVNGTYRKQYHFTALPDNVNTSVIWIEGIGNSYSGDLLTTVETDPTCDCGLHALCFMKDGAWQYHNPLYYDACYTALALSNVTKAETITIIPNPVSGISYLSINSSSNYSMVTIYNISGQALFSKAVSNNQNVTISKADMPAGIYFYHLTGKNAQPVTGKFVVE